jgi:phenylpropionate dioxygenase-like ring-hydroxylating dioxygenase large terminal subunit
VNSKINRIERNTFWSIPLVRSSRISASSVDMENDVSTVQEGSQVFTWSDQWYPVRPISYLKDIANEAIPFRLLGRHLVLWKSNTTDTFSVMEDECPHRRAPLSTGKIINGCNLMCRFHGWTFNEHGHCTDIPMYPKEESNDDNTADNDKRYTKLLSTIKVQDYPTKIAGGLLWVYLKRDETSIIKPLDDAMVFSAETDFMYNIVPVGYTSMVENSFDPSHAPFIHEGIDDLTGGSFSPDDALPMKKYTLEQNTTLTSSGFVMIHTPYQKSSKADSIVTRQLLPPTVQKTTFPFFSMFIYFVPVSVRETLVIGTVPFRFLPKSISKFVPKRYHEYILDWLHFLFVINKSTKRFYQQDMVTMRGQDSRKLIQTKLDAGAVVVDMAPTPSDVRTISNYAINVMVLFDFLLLVCVH